MSHLKRIIILFLCLVACSGRAAAKTVRLDYIGENPLRNGKPIKDTIPQVDLLGKITWDVLVTTKSGKTKQYATSLPDTIVLDEPFTMKLTGALEVNPALLNNVYYIGYGITGSVSLKINGASVFNTGSYCKDGSSNKRLHLSREQVAFIFRDTLEKIEIEYASYPHINFMKLDLSIVQPEMAQQVMSKKARNINDDYGLGYYYLAFAIIFIIFFLFLRERTENLYFSLFCLFASLSFLWSNFDLDILPGLDSYLTVIALEFLAIFFARIIKNVEKSKIPLLVIIVLSAISYLPAIQYNYSFFLSNQPIPLIRASIIAIMMIYAGVFSLYYIIQGIGQKRWEARAIVIIISTAVVCFFLLPFIIMSIVSANQPNNIASTGAMLRYLLYIGLCIYPLSAAIVLGRRNGLNQKQLIDQVKSIERLSEENMEKEKEKQLLLENQKTELELKVAERTSEVQKQKELIELKNKAITDNINYAQRIQSAILPDIKLIYKALEHSFILFLPKDIVSGDFYAFAEKNNRVLIIAGDCTGHGVSGAFMSMIGSSLLNQIINERGVYEPAQILNLLNIAVIESLKQSVNESNDGMDISICSFDLNNNELHYAGANRPLWLVRNGTLEVFKPDKFPIGGLQSARERVFTNYEIPLQKNDAIYIFTDGYADQFGGENGKKMMTAKFKEMLLGMQDISMREQEQKLKSHFENWKGANEQVDDVLVIGVRV